MRNSIYNLGEKVFTFFNEKGTNCTKTEDSNHNKKRQGTIQKINFDNYRKTFVLNVKTETGFFLCEEENLTLCTN